MAKLLRKDVLKWIQNLKNGSYKKTKRMLVSQNGEAFCCLGVWADQHGCTWDVGENGNLIPIAPGRRKAAKDQGVGTLLPRVAFGLGYGVQTQLADLNDTHKTWKQVIDYIKVNILPEAK